MELEAPQYPSGLFLTAYVNHLTGDVKEIDGLEPLHRHASRWAKPPRSSVPPPSGCSSRCSCSSRAAFVHSKWAVLLAVPCQFRSPAFFLVGPLLLDADVRAQSGQRTRALKLSEAVRPHRHRRGRHRSVQDLRRTPEPVHWLAVASGAVIVGFLFHRRAYRPLHKRLAAQAAAQAAQRRMNVLSSSPSTCIAAVIAAGPSRRMATPAMLMQPPTGSPPSKVSLRDSSGFNAHRHASSPPSRRTIHGPHRRLSRAPRIDKASRPACRIYAVIDGAAAATSSRSRARCHRPRVHDPNTGSTWTRRTPRSARWRRESGHRDKYDRRHPLRDRPREAPDSRVAGTVIGGKARWMSPSRDGLRAGRDPRDLRRRHP